MKPDYQKRFKYQAVLSGLLALLFCIGSVFFFASLYCSYTPNNIETGIGFASDVYIKSGRYKGFWIGLSDETELHIVKSSFQKTEHAIGYSISELDDLLSGQKIEYSYFSPRKHEKWLTEIQAGDTKIDLSKQCEAACRESRIGTVVIGGMVIAMLTAAEILYLKYKYNIYTKLKKQEIRNAKRTNKT